nr:competence protein CoiA family protein [Pontibacillus yanchengensis]
MYIFRKECNYVLRALNRLGKEFLLMDCSNEEIRHIRGLESFFCPTCKEKVLIRAGSKVVPHFAHKPYSRCVNASNGEGNYHERGKIHLFKWLQAQGYHAMLEAYIPEIKQRPDIFLTIKRKKIAIEYQCCRISPEMMLARTKGYQRYGIIPIWILGGNRLKRNQQNIVTLSSYDQLFFHQFQSNSPISVYYYCPDAKQFSTFQTPYPISKTKMIGTLHFTSIQSLTFPQLLNLQSNLHPNVLVDLWINEKRNFRKKPHSIFKAQEAYSIHQYLYHRGYHASLLPSIINLPIQTLFPNEEPYSWQAKWIIENVLPLPLGGRISATDTVKDCYPLMNNEPRPYYAYACLLARIGLLKHLHGIIFEKRMEVEFPRTLHDGIKQDEELISLLKSRIKE